MHRIRGLGRVLLFVSVGLCGIFAGRKLTLHLFKAFAVLSAEGLLLFLQVLDAATQGVGDLQFFVSRIVAGAGASTFQRGF